MGAPPSRVASSSTCNSKKHKVPPDRAGSNAPLDSDCTARLQSNLSDSVVMGSPPHPWAPDSDEGQYFASRPPLSLSVSSCVSPSPPLLLVQLSGAIGNTSTRPWTLRLKGTPHRPILCVYTIPNYVLAYSLRNHSSPDRCLYCNQLVAISPHHILTMARCCHWTAHSALKLHLPRPRGPSS